MHAKFRVWDNKEKKWFETIYDATRGRLEEMTLGQSGELMLRTISNFTHVPSIYPDRFTYQFFTGLNDMNGKEIYEGDILQQYPTSKYLRWEVKYSIEDGVNLSTSADYEVIGNIYENPDLLHL